MKRRDFLKVITAGVTVAVLPSIGIASNHTAKFSQLDIPETSIIFKLHYGVSPSDPLNQRAVLQWTGFGLDGVKYSDYCEITVDAFEEFMYAGDEIHKLLVEQIEEIPQLAHLKIPTWDNVATEIRKKAKEIG